MGKVLARHGAVPAKDFFLPARGNFGKDRPAEALEKKNKEAI